MRRYFWNGTWLCILIGMILALAATGLADTLLTVMGTPAELFSMSSVYIRILFAGIPASILYNYSASVMRAAGDSRHPFYFLLISSVLNVILDYVLIIFGGMGVDGAAAATVFSQFFSGVLNVWWMFRHMDIFQIRKEEMRASGTHIRRLCVVGLPMGFEYSVSAIGAVVIQCCYLGSTSGIEQTPGLPGTGRKHICDSQRRRQISLHLQLSFRISWFAYDIPEYAAGNGVQHPCDYFRCVGAGRQKPGRMDGSACCRIHRRMSGKSFRMDICPYILHYTCCIYDSQEFVIYLEIRVRNFFSTGWSWLFWQYTPKEISGRSVTGI